MEKLQERLAFLNTVVGSKMRRVGGAGAYFDKEMKEFLAQKQIVVEDGWDQFKLTASAAKAGLIATEQLVGRTKGDPTIPTSASFRTGGRSSRR